ncbi:MAG TPA: DoxX family protein [Actinophytocola sp.]|uniref:DoxX family protein n=1 Tax=Actinophytocola sp. TaxID=1872138 RepID=UPI002DDD3C98|nr:DoxX family protein [Actinophytocola sp.]HEV2783229.1 DoxX family protein [Actinophytocola sp.]
MTITDSRDRFDVNAVPQRGQDQIRQLASWLLRLTRRRSLAVLRIALGVVYVWFGALKLTATTPVSALVEATTPWADPGWFIPAMGAFEVVLGLWLMLGRGLVFALPLFVAHMLGTFGVLVMVPDVAFQAGNPLRLTVEGEFVVKNLVLLAAVLVVATKTRRHPVS